VVRPGRTRLIKVPKVVQDEMLAAAAAEYNRECMGLLFGWVSRNGREYEIDCAIPIQTARRASDWVYVPDKEWKRLRRMAEVFAPRRIIPVGFYHSHPNATPSPSIDDIGASIDNSQGLIPERVVPIELIVGVSAKTKVRGRSRFLERDKVWNIRVTGFDDGEVPEEVRKAEVVGRIIRVPVAKDRMQEFKIAAWAFYLDKEDEERFEPCRINVTN
jgi:proteasome lid subunit RPN8/RPN11